MLLSGPATLRKAVYARLAGSAELMALLNNESARVAYGMLPDLPALFGAQNFKPFICFSQLAGGEIWSTSAVADPAAETGGEVSVVVLAVAQAEGEHDAQHSGFGTIEQILQTMAGLLHQYSDTVEGRLVKFRLAEPISQMVAMEGRIWRCEGLRLAAVFCAYAG